MMMSDLTMDELVERYRKGVEKARDRGSDWMGLSEREWYAKWTAAKEMRRAARREQ
jgi:hypothetical protein